MTSPAAGAAGSYTSGVRVVFTGNGEGERLGQLSGHAVLFVLPSMLEGLPIVVLEMLLLGVPVLASDIGPSREVLNDGEFGVLFHAGDVADLKVKLVEALGNTADLREKAAAGRRHIRIANEWDRIAEQTEKLYEEVLAG